MPERSVISMVGDDEPRTMDDGWLSMVNGLLSIVRDKFHCIAGNEEERCFTQRVEQLERSVTEDVPAARRVNGVDSSLRSGDGDGTCRDVSPRGGHARHGESFIEDSHVGKSGCEAHHVDDVLAFAVQANQFGGR